MENGPAERILPFANQQLAATPEVQHEEILHEVMRVLTTWREAIRVGNEPQRIQNKL